MGRTRSLAEAERIGADVEALYTAGPAAGGGAMKSALEVMTIKSALVSREWARTAVAMEVSRPTILHDIAPATKATHRTFR